MYDNQNMLQKYIQQEQTTTHHPDSTLPPDPTNLQPIGIQKDPVVNIESQLQEIGFQTELDHDSLQYTIDVARPTQPLTQIVTELSTTYKVKTENGEYKAFDWNDENTWKSELAELILPHIDQIVTNYKLDEANEIKTIIMQKPIGTALDRHSEEMLTFSIQKVLVHFHG